MSSTPPPPATLDRAWIAAHIPHSGAMCLLDSVEAWSEDTIRCVATSHRDPHNPLRSNGRLAAVCGVEYAAQAMAVHGAALGTTQGRPRAGLLASLRGVEAHVARLDTLDGPLTIEAERISADAGNVLYRFALRCDAQLVMTGRAAVILDASGTRLNFGTAQQDPDR
ncbi:hydroxymyristoyl-ACP dehydratase [Trinickia terrae]|uniref:Hydroxymyristoyl-ACP dehydratase n=1 Tax=Trinickia terrae TaxID=2571161 RepID=A0A4U1I1C7_9BURK|nr:hotdog family protein [Trinickia terrae]TKC86915.1 hydroxymyristoyl-ACP dehydratase [Trinickia terrae]